MECGNTVGEGGAWLALLESQQGREAMVRRPTGTLWLSCLSGFNVMIVLL